MAALPPTTPQIASSSSASGSRGLAMRLKGALRGSARVVERLDAMHSLSHQVKAAECELRCAACEGGEAGGA